MSDKVAVFVGPLYENGALVRVHFIDFNHANTPKDEMIRSAKIAVETSSWEFVGLFRREAVPDGACVRGAHRVNDAFTYAAGLNRSFSPEVQDALDRLT